MPVLKRTQMIAAPPEKVFGAIVDLEGFPKWNPTTKSARKTSDGPIGEGTRFDLQVKGFGVVPQELQEFQKDRRVRIVPTMKMFSGGHRFMLSPQGAGTRVDHELEMTPKGIYKLMGPMMGVMGRKNLKDTAASLQRYVESL
jgi:uncharacterized protein YndB with AHSA1/START domain